MATKKHNYLLTWDQFNKDPNHVIFDDEVYNRYHLLSYSDYCNNKLWQLSQYLLNASEFKDVLIVESFSHWIHGYDVLAIPINTDKKVLTKLNNFLNRVINRNLIVTYNLNLNNKMSEYLKELFYTQVKLQFDNDYVELDKFKLGSNQFTVKLDSTWYSNVTVNDLLNNGIISTDILFNWLNDMDCLTYRYSGYCNEIDYEIDYDNSNDIIDLVLTLPSCKWLKLSE